ncbi:MAG: hypothetical protein QN183_03635 [Armatimonadota bacterium]|nr:hypothetical protein [Armatimonadota bacterium]MDR7484929.1 hypothetical protein [Armatimonadota bacterium]MDR7534625.1 hypothetical protein [Armatimonadota bacterium]MDR7535443.1 hypothetical protein [Armatimonadota bacterium]
MARFLVAATVLALLAAAAARGDEQATIARTLAENILGKGTVHSSRMIEDGRAVDLVWESATFKPTNGAAFTRELLQAEVQLAAGAIFHVLRHVQGVQFEIVRGRRRLCAGRASRDRPLLIRYARDLDG